MHGIRLWVDDKRPAPDGWLHVKTAVDAIEILARQHVAELALDHDLGHCEKCTACHGYKSKCGCTCHWSGYSVALFMATTGRWPDQKPTCHSANPAGRANIEATIERYYGCKIASDPGEFRLTWRELERARDFQETHGLRHGPEPGGGVGGRFTYRFTPTGFGVVAEVGCYCGEKLGVTDFSNW